MTGAIAESAGNAAFKLKVAPNVQLTCVPFEVSDKGRSIVQTELSKEAIDSLQAMFRLPPEAAAEPSND